MGAIRRQAVIMAGMVLLFTGCGGLNYYDLQTEIPAGPGETRIDKVLLV